MKKSSRFRGPRWLSLLDRGRYLRMPRIWIVDASTSRNRAVWDAHASADPLWAVLSLDDKKGRRWQLQEFMKTGEREIALLWYELARIGRALPDGPVLDFGCGVGRLTQALGRRRSDVLGVDVSPVMLDIASRLNAYPDRVRYRENTAPAFPGLPREAFALIYSNIVLQHIEPSLAVEYLNGFFDLLAPPGMLVFQLPSHRRQDREVEIRPLPDRAYRAALAFARPVPALADGSSEMAVLLRVRNASDHTWRQSEHGPMAVGNHWLDASGQRLLVQDDARAPLLQEVAPGQEWPVLITLHMPHAPGRYTGEIDLVHEGVTWFEHKGSPTLRFTIDVRASAAEPRVQAPPVLQEYLVPDYPEFALPPRPSNNGADPSPFAMHAIPRDEILALIRARGGELVHIEEDGRAGPEWVSYRYFVARSPA